MTVIALTTVGTSPSVVTEPDRFNLAHTALCIREAELSQLDGTSQECNASYDLRVGNTYREHRDDNARTLDRDGVINLLPGAAVLIQTEEWVQFPRMRFGQILPKVTLLQKGIANTPTKIDPGYHGHLIITVFNHGKRAVSLRRGERFCSLYVLDVSGDIRAYKKGGKQIEGAAGTKVWQRFNDWLQPYGTLVSLGSLLIAIIALLHSH